MAEIPSAGAESDETLSVTEAAERDEARRQAAVGRGVAQIQTGTPEGLAQGARNIAEATNPRSKEGMIAGFKARVESANLPPTKPDVFFRGEEKRRMDQIIAGLKVHSGRDRPNRSDRTSYLQPWKGTLEYEVDNSRIKADTEWLANDMRMGKNADPERRQYFSAYHSLLLRLSGLNRPERNYAFTSENGSLEQCKNTLKNACRNPKSVGSATRMTILLAVAGLAIAWGISDYRNKKLSLGTMALIGGVALLMYKSSKFDFLGGEALARAAKGRLDAKTTAKLQNLARSNPTAYGHLLSVMRGASRKEPIGEKVIHELTNPTKNRRGKQVPDSAKAIPEDIARLFIGKNASDVYIALYGFNKTARTKDRSKVSAYVGALSENGEQTRRDLETARSTSS